MTILNENSINFNKREKVNSDSGDLTGDAGILLYKEFDHVIVLSHVIEEIVHVKENVIHRTHQNNDVIMQKIYQNAAGYHADDHADHLRYDPALMTVLNKSELASQPTMSRLNQQLDIDKTTVLYK